MATDLTVRVRALDGSVGATDWLTLGNGRARGIVPQNVTLSADQSGPTSAGMVLRRDPKVPWGDILAATQMEVEVGGVVVWGGRISQTPTSADQVSVTGQGWQYHLDDDQIQRLYVQTSLGAYRDQREFNPTYAVATFKAGAVVAANGNAMTLVFPKNFVVAQFDAVGVSIDVGASLINRVVVTWERIGINDVDDTIYSRASNSADASTGADDSTSLLNVASGTIAHTTTGARRYHHLLVVRNGAGATFGADQGVRINTVQLFGSTSYESGNASVLKASQIFADVLSSGGLPLLDTDTDRITTTSFSIPDFAPDGYRTPREILAAANAYHDYLWGVDANRKLFLTARPTTPLYEVGSWSAADFADASAGNLEDLYNKVIVEYEAPNGTPGFNVRTSTSNVLTRQGLTRTKRLGVSAALTSAAADQIGDTWLLRRATTPPLRGSFKATAGAVRYLASGADVHPAWLLLGTGQIVRLLDRIDPDTGGWGRDGNVISVTYSHDNEEATVQLDNDSTSLEALLARLALMQGRGTV